MKCCCSGVPHGLGVLNAMRTVVTWEMGFCLVYHCPASLLKPLITIWLFHSWMAQGGSGASVSVHWAQHADNPKQSLLCSLCLEWDWGVDRGTGSKHSVSDNTSLPCQWLLTISKGPETVAVWSSIIFEMLVKPSEESGSSQPRSMEIAKQQLFRPKVTQKYLAAAFICSLFIYFKGIWEMQFLMANTERQGNMRKLILFHHQINEVSCASK